MTVRAPAPHPDSRPPLALTMGEAGGVGGEIAVAAWTALRRETGAAFFCIDCPARLRALGAPVAEIADPATAAAHFSDALPVLPEPLAEPAAPGRPALSAAPATLRSIERGVALALSGAVSALVTNPIDKKALRDGAGFRHPGHTELLAELGGGGHPVMLLACPALKVAPLTIHTPLRAVADVITAPLIEATARVLEAALRRDFGVAAPRIAVAGLNPHAGEGGMLGDEEIEVIAPALERLRAEGLDLRGPLSADAMFHPAARAGYDAALCMYHDQALIPIKTIDFDNGVNVTLGLPFIRTSPDHGVAYDIAGQGRASASSLVAAIRLAGEMADRRRAADQRQPER